MSKPKYSMEFQIWVCENFLSDKYSAAQVCEKYGITYNEKNHSSSSLNEWAAKYGAVESAEITTDTRIVVNSTGKLNDGDVV